MKRFWTVMKKEIFHIIRDPRTLGMMLLLPAMLLILLGYGISGESKDVKLVIADFSKSDLSRWYIDQFTQSHDFAPYMYVNNEAEIVTEIDRDTADVGILIPPDLDAKVLRGEYAPVQIYVDGSLNPTDALTVQLKLNSIAGTASQKLLMQEVTKLGYARNLNLPITGIVKTLYNPSNDRKLYMIPSLIPIILQIQTLILSALSIVREREQGTMEQLIVTPVRAWELMLGKIMPYLLVSLANLFVLLWLSKIMFGVTVAGSVWELLLMSVIFMIGSLGMGVLISNISQTQMQSIYIALFIVLIPAIILSGMLFSRDSMPAVTYWYSELLPVTQYLEITAGIIVRGAKMATMWASSILPMAILSIVYFVASVLAFRKRM